MSITSAVAHAAAAAAAAGAGKKAAQVQLQAELNTDDEWNKFLLRDGLLVIDVYTEWCGPCLGMVGNLKKIKVEIGGDNLHLAVAKADTIECLKRFRNRSEPTWMFIAGGQLLNVVFGANAPRLARTIEQELRNEEQVRQGARERPQRAPHDLTPPEQEVALAQAQLAAERRAREAAAAAAARAARRAARADRLDAAFPDVCPALLLPHAQKHLRKVSDALEPYGVIVADKYPLVLGKETAAALAAEDPELGGEGAAGALAERPALALVLKRLPDREGNVVELTRRALFGDGLELAEGEAPRKTVAEELRADGVPGLFAPADRDQRAAALDLLFPKMVSTAVEPPPPVEPPHVAVVFGAWQRRAALAAVPAPRLLRYGFFADTDISQPRLLCKTIDKYEERVDKDYCETIALMVAVGVPEEGSEAPDPPGPPAALLALGPLHVSADAVAGADECARLFPPGYSAPDPKPKPKAKKKKKKRHEAKEEDATESTAEPAGAATTAAAGGAEGGAEGGEGEADGEGEGDGEGEAEGEGEGGSLEEAEDEDTHQDKATSPPPVG